MKEIRLHGRGGQGSLIASKILAVAAFEEGSRVQSFPKFGVEPRGDLLKRSCKSQRIKSWVEAK